MYAPIVIDSESDADDHTDYPAVERYGALPVSTSMLFLAPLLEIMYTDILLQSTGFELEC